MVIKINTLCYIGQNGLKYSFQTTVAKLALVEMKKVVFTMTIRGKVGKHIHTLTLTYTIKLKEQRPLLKTTQERVEAARADVATTRHRLGGRRRCIQGFHLCARNNCTAGQTRKYWVNAAR